jgi:hypothetical protein
MAETKERRQPAFTVLVEANGDTRRVKGIVPAPKPERVKATPEMREALRLRYEEEQKTREQLEIIMREETKKLRARNKGTEYERVERTRTIKIKQFTERTDKLVLDTDNHTREIRKVATTISRLEKSHRLTRELAGYLHTFAQRVAEGLGAATEDGDDSTSRLTSAYEPMGGGSFGSKTPSDLQLTGTMCLQEMKKRVPKELLSIFNQIVDEETEGWHDRRRSLKEMGEELGYQDSQASAAGGALVHAVTCLVAHFIRESRYLTRGPLKSVA